jgi:hypothetical protein
VRRTSAQPEQRDDRLRERLLLLDREASGEERVVDVGVAELGDQRHELGLDRLEDVPHVGRGRLRLEVVEEDVVGLVDAFEALHVAQAQLDVPLERRPEERVVRLRARLHPERARLRPGPRHLRAQLRRHAHRLLVVAAREPDQRRVVRVGVERLLVRPELVQEPAGLVGDQELVGDALQGGKMIRAVRRAGGRHHRLLIPGEDADDPPEVGDPREPLLQLGERVGQEPEPIGVRATGDA